MYTLIFLSMFLTQTAALCLPVSPKTQFEEHIYASYLGGSMRDEIRDLILDTNGNMIVLGGTFSDDFPVHDAFQSSYAGGVQPDEPPFYGGDGFIAMFSNMGEMIWSTYIGGSMLDNCERGEIIGDEIIVIGVTNSVDIPIIGEVGQGVYGGGQGDAFLAVYSNTGELLRSTYFGGSGTELPEDIIVNDDGDVIIVGYTESDDLPVTENAYQKSVNGNSDGFIAKIDPHSFQINYLSYFGGSDRDSIGDIEINPVDGSIYVIGHSTSRDLPIANNAFQSSIIGQERDIYLAKFNETFGLEYATYLGGSDMDDCFGLAIDSQGSVILSGRTWSDDFPVVDAYQPQYSGIEVDGFYAKFSPEGNSLVFSSYLGYSGWDTLNRVSVTAEDGILLAGMADTDDFPVISGFQESKRAGTDIYVLMLDADGNHLFATYLGGDGMEHPWDCRIDGEYMYLVAQTASSNIITSDDAFMSNYAGETDGYLFRLDLEEYLAAQPELDKTLEDDEAASISSYWVSYFIVTALVLFVGAGWYLYIKNIINQ